EVARALLAAGWRVAVLGGPGDREVAARVAGAAPGSLDLAGAADLPRLAALLSLLRLLVTNDTGPMHLAAAVGVPTASVWGPSDPGETALPWRGHALVAASGLPCKPCRRNHCPRSGRGTMLPDAHEECMGLVDAGRVVDMVHEILEGDRP
ncbi:MAG: glycosyltransferase family 9 protein, partial [Gemmatimonadetes bacterium]|nr:glycosyltransferase family 9 protein [Gemmatimonadota bacterium]